MTGVKTVPEGRRHHTVAWLSGAAVIAALMPGTCPACWPGYVGLAASLGLGATGAARAPGVLFASLLCAAAGGIVRQAWRRGAWAAGIAALVGTALLIEAWCLGRAGHLRVIGTVLLIGSAFECLKRPAQRKPVLITIERRD